jgi:twinkle protein
MADYKKMHIACPHCESSDGAVINKDGSHYCFACSTHTRPSEASDSVTYTHVPPKAQKAHLSRSDAFEVGISDRRLALKTAERFGVKVTTDGEVIFPYFNKGGEQVANKVRGVEKTFKVEGEWKAALLFGQNCFSKGGDVVTICEGEFDAMSAYQMLGGKQAVVSIRSGAQSALSDCKASYEWLDSFNKVVICFDNDEVGREAANKVAELFSGKALLFKHNLTHKDASDWLVNRHEALFSQAWASSEKYKPEGIVTISDIKERMLTPPVPGVPWCFDTLTELTYGRRAGELYAFGAGVGVGKTDVFTQQIAYDIDTLGLKVGVIYLEQNVVETGQRVMGKLDKRLYHVPDADWTREQYEGGVNRLEAREQLFMMEHFGAMDWKTIKGIIKYFNKAYDIKHIYLDHLTALSANEQDERRALDGIMADMASLAQELGVTIHFISHLTTPEGKSHEEGGRVMEKHFTGSRAIARWSHYMFGLERNKQHTDPVKRQTTTFRVLKDRFTGRATGIKFGLQYNQKNGILTESVNLMEDDNL